jgi:hypothetical protein
MNIDNYIGFIKMLGVDLLLTVFIPLLLYILVWKTIKRVLYGY